MKAQANRPDSVNGSFRPRPGSLPEGAGEAGRTDRCNASTNGQCGKSREGRIAQAFRLA